MYENRIGLYREIEKIRNSRVIAYVTGDRQNMETSIASDVIDLFSEHLDLIFRKSSKISLILYSQGGSVLAAWNIVNMIRMFCDEFEVIIPRKAHSAATLISIGADKIVMTKQSTLGPIDPSVGGPYNPTINQMGQNMTLPVSVEDVGGFFDLASNEMKDQKDLRLAFESLVKHVHPLALGQVARSRAQIKKLAERLLKNHMPDDDQIKNIIDFLCSESGSHDYTINRREAKNNLHLPIEKPSDDLYSILKSLHADICNELELGSTFNPQTLAGPVGGPPRTYKVTRGLVESIAGGSDKYITIGTVSSMVQDMQVMPGAPITRQIITTDQRIKDGWEHEEALQENNR